VNEPKLCPFCGDDMVWTSVDAHNADIGYSQCTCCDARGPKVVIKDHTDWKDDAINEWNTRHDIISEETE